MQLSDDELFAAPMANNPRRARICHWRWLTFPQLSVNHIAYGLTALRGSIRRGVSG